MAVPSCRQDEAPIGRDDSPRLLVLLGLFTVACLVVVAALLGAAAIDTWWALAAALVVHVAMTAVSFAGVLYVFRGHLHR